MFHARIRTPNDVFHLIAEVNSYNLQTLRQHLRQSLREDGSLQISVLLDPGDQRAFARYTSRWLPKMIETGAQVAVEVAPPAGDSPAGSADPQPIPFAAPRVGAPSLAR